MKAPSPGSAAAADAAINVSAACGQNRQRLHSGAVSAEAVTKRVRSLSQRLQRVLGPHPVTLACDTDRLDHVFVGVGRGQHVASRYAGHVVFSGASSKKHHQPDPEVFHVGDASAGRGLLRRRSCRAASTIRHRDGASMIRVATSQVGA